MHPNVTSKEKLLLAAKELAQALPLVPFTIIFPTKTLC